MKLTKEDKMQLMEWGYKECGLPQIEEATCGNRTTYIMGQTSISKEEAIRVLGRREYLSGIARSAFHCSAVRAGADGQTVLFDSSRLFQMGCTPRRSIPGARL